MLKDASKNMKLSRVNDGEAAVDRESRQPLDIPAAVSLKNVLFFFSLVFRYPGEAVYRELGRSLPLFEDFFTAYAGSSPELPEAEELQAEYVRLFVNNRGRVPAVPYASFHLDGGTLMGESYHKLHRMMEKTGFVLDKSAGELEDHLAILLEFCSIITERLIDASTSGRPAMDEMANVFGQVIVQYLRPLVKSIMAGVSKNSVMEFYSVSARALLRFLADVKGIYAHVFSVSLSVAFRTGVEK